MTDITPPSITLTACDPAEWERANGMSIKTACAFVVLVAEVTTARTERDAAVARADKAEVELQARADERDMTISQAVKWQRLADGLKRCEEIVMESLGKTQKQRDEALARAEKAEKAEAELALAVRLVREWSALYGGTVYEVVGTREFLARHVG